MRREELSPQWAGCLKDKDMEAIISGVRKVKDRGWCGIVGKGMEYELRLNSSNSCSTTHGILVSKPELPSPGTKQECS